MTDAMPSPEALEGVFHMALEAGDVRGVDAALRLLAVKDPGRAKRLYDDLSTAIDLAHQLHNVPHTRSTADG